MTNAEFKQDLLDKTARVQELISAKAAEGDIIAAVDDLDKAARAHVFDEDRSDDAKVPAPLPINMESKKPSEQLNKIDSIIQEGDSAEAVTASDPTQTAGNIPS